MTILLVEFFLWYFYLFPRRILENGRYFMIWCWRSFSIGFFLPRIFSPWHKDITSYGRGFEFKTWMHAFAWNLISRVLGAILRIFFIVSGIVFEVGIFAVTIWLFFLWYALPAVLIYLVASII